MKADLRQLAANIIHLHSEEITELLRLLEYFEDLFDGTLGDWDTDPIDLALKPGSKPFNSKYYPVPRINKEIVCKYLKLLAETGVITLVQQSQYSTPLFIIPKK